MALVYTGPMPSKCLQTTTPQDSHSLSSVFFVFFFLFGFILTPLEQGPSGLPIL